MFNNDLANFEILYVSSTKPMLWKVGGGLLDAGTRSTNSHIQGKWVEPGP